MSRPQTSNAMLLRIELPFDEPCRRLARLPGVRWHATEHPLHLLQTGMQATGVSSAPANVAQHRRSGHPARRTPTQRLPVAHTVYKCPRCGERFLGERRCGDCHVVYARSIGLGGSCPDCDTVILLADLLGPEVLTTSCLARVSSIRESTCWTD